MIELILTNTLDSFPILDKLKNSLDKTKKHLVFVPDRFSLSYQKAVLEFLNIKGSFDIEVTSFVRLANKLLENDKKVLDKQSEVMLLRKVIEENKKDLLCFANASNSVNFANDMYAAISQIRNSNIPVKKMADIAEKLPVRVANKTKDIVRIYREYVDFLQKGYTDGTSKLQALTDKIYEGCLNDCNIYISDFMSFSNVEYEAIKAIMTNSMNTYICLVDSNGENKHIFPKEVKDRILSLADEIGQKAKISYCEEKLVGDAKIINEELYGYAPSFNTKRDNRTEIIVCKDIAQEVKTVARQINDIVRTKGARYKDIAIVCCDFSGYTPYIKSVFDNFSIPFYADIKQPLKEQAITKLISAAIKAVIGNFESSDMYELAKQILLLFEYDDICIFENYCLKYGIEYTRFLSPFSIGEENDRNIAEGIRKRLIDILKPLRELKGDVSSYAKAVRDFLKNIDADILIDTLAKKQQDNGFEELSGITMQSLQKINILLERCENMLGSNIMEFEEFYNIFMTAVESVEMSNIPLYVDSVFIGESSQSRYEDIDYMFVLGSTSSKFPLEHSDNGIVAEREYVAWSRMGIDVQPDCRRRNALERLNVLMLLTRAKKKLVISYPSTSVSGAELLPSNTLNYICNLFDTKPLPVDEPNQTWDIDKYIRYISSRGNVLQELLALSKLFSQGAVEVSDTFAKTIDILYDISVKKYGKTYVDNLLAGDTEEDELTKDKDIMFKGNHTSVSQFEKYFKCPFLHFNENVLGLKTREINGLEVKDTGILLHATLEKYFSLPDCADKSIAEIEKIVPELFLQSVKENDDYKFLLEDENQTLMFVQLSSQAVYVVKNLVANMQMTKFRPYKLEAYFGNTSRGGLKGMEIDNGYRKLSFVGVIDRIDRYKDRAIIIDYKSKYNIDFAPSNIIYGDRIQLFVYLNALLNNECLTPQGVFYLLMNNRFIKGGDDFEKRFMHKGFVNSDENLVNDLDKGFESGGNFSSLVYPIKRKVTKDNASLEAQKSGYALSTEQFKKTCDYVIKLTSKAAKEIEEGYIAKSPLAIEPKDDDIKVCAYCNYRNVCDRSILKVRKVKDIKEQEFKEIIGD